MDKNNSNKNIKLQIKSFLKKISLQLYSKRVNVPTVSKTRWQSIPYCYSSMEKGPIAKSLLCHLRDHKQCFRIRPQTVSVNKSLICRLKALMSASMAKKLSGLSRNKPQSSSEKLLNGINCYSPHSRLNCKEELCLSLNSNVLSIKEIFSVFIPGKLCCFK